MTTIAQIPKSPRIAKSVSIGRCTRKQAETHEANMIAKGRTPSNHTMSLRWDSSNYWHEDNKIGTDQPYSNDAKELQFSLTLDSNGTIAATCDITKSDLLEMLRHIEAIEAQQGLTLSKLEGLEAFKKGAAPRAILEQASLL